MSDVAVVTGAASGIGAACVSALAAEGYRVAALDLDGNAAESIVRTCGDGHLAIAVDVTDEAAVVAAFDEILRAFGRIDALATCAGITDTTPFMDATVAEFRRAFDINVIGTYLCMREAARRMQRGGRICTVSSVAGLRGGGIFGQAAYSASKGAVIALTRNAARSLAGLGLRVNGVAPASTATPMMNVALQDDALRKRIVDGIPLGRVSDAAEQAAAITWLLSPASSYVHGETLVVDGGVMMS